MEAPYKKCECGREMSAYIVNKQIDYPDVPVEGVGNTVRNLDGTPIERPMTAQERENWKKTVYIMRHLPKANPEDILYICPCGKVDRVHSADLDKMDIDINTVLLNTPVKFIPEISDMIRWNGIEPQEIIGERPQLTEPQRKKTQERLVNMYLQSELALDRFRHNVLEELETF